MVRTIMEAYHDISFLSGAEVIHSSLTTTQYPLSMFRLRV
jgi:hypothetical protein